MGILRSDHLVGRRPTSFTRGTRAKGPIRRSRRLAVFGRATPEPPRSSAWPGPSTSGRRVPPTSRSMARRCSPPSSSGRRSS